MTTDLGIELPAPPREEPPRSTETEMLSMLRRHYLPDELKPAGVFAAQINSPGSSGRRADLIWLGVTAATGGQLVGHEIKVTRADVQAELADLAKSDPWQRYCDRWWLVIPHRSLIEGLDIPESWGVMLPPSGRRTRSMTIHRPAPQLDPVNQAPALRAVAARLHWQLRDADVHKTQMEYHTDTLRKQISELRLHGTAIVDPVREFVGQVVRQLGGTWDGKTIPAGIWGRLTIDDVVAALRDLQSARDRLEQAESAYSQAVAQLTSAQTTIGFVLKDLDAKTTKGQST